MVSPRTVAALRAASDAGVVVVAATGRSHRTALPLLEPIGVVSWAVCSNGATLYDLGAGAVDGHHAIGGAEVDELVDGLCTAIDGVAFAWEAADGFGWDGRFLARHPGADALPYNGPAPDGARPTGPLLKVLVSHPHLRDVPLVDHLAPMLPEGLVVSTSGAPFAEVTAAGVDKAFGLGQLAARLGIDRSEVVAFGDNNNDLAMLAWAGHGVAMGNALPEVAAVADEVTARHDEDGVALVIERVLAES